MKYSTGALLYGWNLGDHINRLPIPNSEIEANKEKSKKMMNELILNLLDKGEKISKYKLESYWIDIGKYDDYEQAKSDYKKILMPNAA